MPICTNILRAETQIKNVTNITNEKNKNTYKHSTAYMLGRRDLESKEGKALMSMY